MKVKTSSTKNYASLPGDKMTLESKFRTFYNVTNDCGIAFYNALITTPHTTLEMICSIYGRLEKEGYSSDELSAAVICSKTLEEADLLSLLWLKKFNFEDCATALFSYGRSKELLMKIIRKAQKWGYTTDLYKIALYAGGDELPAAEFITEIASSKENSKPCFH